MEKAEMLVRYETLAANRRHFELLFFAVVAFSAVMALAIWTAVTALRPALSSLALAGSGVQLLPQPSSRGACCFAQGRRSTR